MANLTLVDTDQVAVGTEIRRFEPINHENVGRFPIDACKLMCDGTLLHGDVSEQALYIVRSSAHRIRIGRLMRAGQKCKLTDEALCAAIDAKFRALSGQYHSVITCDRSYLSTTVENKE